MALVLIVDDVPALAEQYAYDLNRVGGYETRVATDGKEALEIIAWDVVDCVILDLEMPGVDGFEVLRSLKNDGISIPVIVYTGEGSYDRCIQAITLGAYSFIDKSESMERVAQEVENALERTRLQSEVETLKRDAGKDSCLIGSSAAMRQLQEQIARIAPVPSSVLIVGESGTGKELVARELHRLGTDDEAPFIAINSAALPENLIESELFGHERGAFTGANRTHKGAFERASGGTLFLDEIGELPPAAQAKLLRVLDDNQVTRVGGEKSLTIHARVLAATNRNLEAEIAEERFRQDLYYRLNVHLINVPPLRDRRSDIPELVEHLLELTCMRFGVPLKRVSAAAMELLTAYDWRRNNVRELRNVVERMTIASDGETVAPRDVPAEIRGGDTDLGSAPIGGTLQEQKVEAERRIVLVALEENDWQITHTAKALGLSDHSSLLKIMRRHQLKRVR